MCVTGFSLKSGSRGMVKEIQLEESYAFASHTDTHRSNVSGNTCKNKEVERSASLVRINFKKRFDMYKKR